MPVFVEIRIGQALPKPRGQIDGQPLEQFLTVAGALPAALLELDDGTAAIPWELLDAPDDGRGGPDAPWAIRNKLLRRLRTGAFRSLVSDARREENERRVLRLPQTQDEMEPA